MLTTTQEAKKCGKPILYARFGTLKEMQLSFFFEQNAGGKMVTEW